MIIFPPLNVHFLEDIIVPLTNYDQISARAALKHELEILKYLWDRLPGVWYATFDKTTLASVDLALLEKKVHAQKNFAIRQTISLFILTLIQHDQNFVFKRLRRINELEKALVPLTNSLGYVSTHPVMKDLIKDVLEEISSVESELKQLKLTGQGLQSFDTKHIQSNVMQVIIMSISLIVNNL